MLNITRRSRHPFCVSLFAGLVLVLLAGHAEAQTSWYTAGSTGTVDEADVSEVMFDSAAAALRPTAPAQAVAVIRYHISAVNTSYPWRYLTLKMTYQRPDDWSYAAATLKRVRFDDGATSAVMSVNAWDQPPAAGTQVVQKTIACSCFYAEEGRDYAYYVEVTLWKPQAASNPRVLALQMRIHD
jgi:hypothetical protein